MRDLMIVDIDPWGVDDDQGNEDDADKDDKLLCFVHFSCTRMISLPWPSLNSVFEPERQEQAETTVLSNCWPCRSRCSLLLGFLFAGTVTLASVSSEQLVLVASNHKSGDKYCHRCRHSSDEDRGDEVAYQS